MKTLNFFFTAIVVFIASFAVSVAVSFVLVEMMNSFDLENMVAGLCSLLFIVAAASYYKNICNIDIDSL